MSCQRIMMVLLALLLAAVFPVQAGPVKGMPVKPLKQWSGSVAEVSLMAGAPEVIVSAQEMDKLWQAWKVEGPTPEVDFAQDLVLVLTTRGSILRFGAVLSDKGDLEVMGVTTKDLRPGFRHVIAQVSREGVKTVNGKALGEKAATSPPGPAKGTPVKIVQQWKGSVADLSLLEGAPEVILSAQELDKLWQAWKVEGPAPKVDFAKELVVMGTTRGSILRLTPTLDDKGDLKVMGVATMDLRPGFRYVIAQVSREGVKTVNGRELGEKAAPGKDR
jgi:hypothetical protein